MPSQLLKAFQILDEKATMKDVHEACRNLFLQSDEYQLVQHPFGNSEIDAVANAIYEYILCPDSPTLRQIAFTVERPLEGKAMEYNEYAARFSEDMMWQNASTQFASLIVEDLRRSLKTYLAGIMFRYQFCIFEDRAAFPVSVILDYIEVVDILLSKECRNSELSEALFVTLATLRSLEPRYRMKEDAAEMASEFMKFARHIHNPQ